MSTLTIDLRADAEVELRTILQLLGYLVPPTSDLDDVLVRVLNANHRALGPIKRTVHRSREFQARVLPPAIVPVVNEIIRKAQAGEDLRPFQSKKLADPDYDDMLLNDWGVNHLHVGGFTPGADGFVTRSGELLYVYASGSDLYVLDLLTHGSFVNEALVEILHANWPAVLGRFRLRGIQPVASISQGQRKQLRGAGVSATFQAADGTVYFSPGGGYATSGLSIAVRTRADRFLEALRVQEQWARDNVEGIRDGAAQKLGSRPGDLHLRLKFDELGRVLLVDEANKIVIVTTTVI